ncbi:MAG: LysR family transcriptional regulator [Acidimicrobiales bacterium]
MADPHRQFPAEGPLLNLTVQQLAYLVAVADHETFSEAASSLGVTTSALSQGLAELERRIGVPLFERQGRKQMLRVEGKEILAYAQRVVADTRDLGRWVVSAKLGDVGRVRVGMIDAAALHHLHDAMASFRERQPEVDLRLVVAPSGELLDQLRRGDLDLAVVVDPSMTEGLDLLPIVTESLVIIAPGDQEIGPPETWGPWVLFPRGSRTRELIERALVARGAVVDVVAESHQPDVLLEMTRLGMGWSVLPQAQSGQNDRDKTEVVAERHLVLARPSSRSANPAADQFAHALVD